MDTVVREPTDQACTPRWPITWGGYGRTSRVSGKFKIFRERWFARGTGVPWGNVCRKAGFATVLSSAATAVTKKTVCKILD